MRDSCHNYYNRIEKLADEGKVTEALKLGRKYTKLYKLITGFVPDPEPLIKRISEK